VRQGRLHWVAVAAVAALYGLLLSPLDPLTSQHVVAHQTILMLVVVPFVLGVALGRDVAFGLLLVFPVLGFLLSESCVTHETATVSTTVCNDYALVPGLMLAIAVFVFARSGALFGRGLREAL